MSSLTNCSPTKELSSAAKTTQAAAQSTLGWLSGTWVGKTVAYYAPNFLVERFLDPASAKFLKIRNNAAANQALVDILPHLISLRDSPAINAAFERIAKDGKQGQEQAQKNSPWTMTRMIAELQTVLKENGVQKAFLEILSNLKTIIFNPETKQAIEEVIKLDEVQKLFATQIDSLLEKAQFDAGNKKIIKDLLLKTLPPVLWDVLTNPAVLKTLSNLANPVTNAFSSKTVNSTFNALQNEGWSSASLMGACQTMCKQDIADDHLKGIFDVICEVAKHDKIHEAAKKISELTTTEEVCKAAKQAEAVAGSAIAPLVMKKKAEEVPTLLEMSTLFLRVIPVEIWKMFSDEKMRSAFYQLLSSTFVLIRSDDAQKAFQEVLESDFSYNTLLSVVQKMPKRDELINFLQALRGLLGAPACHTCFIQLLRSPELRRIMMHYGAPVFKSLAGDKLATDEGIQHVLFDLIPDQLIATIQEPKRLAELTTVIDSMLKSLSAADPKQMEEQMAETHGVIMHATIQMIQNNSIEIFSAIAGTLQKHDGTIKLLQGLAVKGITPILPSANDKDAQETWHHVFQTGLAQLQQNNKALGNLFGSFLEVLSHSEAQEFFKLIQSQQATMEDLQYLLQERQGCRTSIVKFLRHLQEAITSPQNRKSLHSLVDSVSKSQTAQKVFHDILRLATSHKIVQDAGIEHTLFSTICDLLCQILQNESRDLNHIFTVMIYYVEEAPRLLNSDPKQIKEAASEASDRITQAVMQVMPNHAPRIFSTAARTLQQYDGTMKLLQGLAVNGITPFLPCAGDKDLQDTWHHVLQTILNQLQGENPDLGHLLGSLVEVLSYPETLKFLKKLQSNQWTQKEFHNLLDVPGCRESIAKALRHLKHAVLSPQIKESLRSLIGSPSTSPMVRKILNSILNPIVGDQITIDIEARKIIRDHIANDPGIQKALYASTPDLLWQVLEENSNNLDFMFSAILNYVESSPKARDATLAHSWDKIHIGLSALAQFVPDIVDIAVRNFRTQHQAYDKELSGRREYLNKISGSEHYSSIAKIIGWLVRDSVIDASQDRSPNRPKWADTFHIPITGAIARKVVLRQHQGNFIAELLERHFLKAFTRFATLLQDHEKDPDFLPNLCTGVLDAVTAHLKQYNIATENGAKVVANADLTKQFQAQRLFPTGNPYQSLSTKIMELLFPNKDEDFDLPDFDFNDQNIFRKLMPEIGQHPRQWLWELVEKNILLEVIQTSFQLIDQDTFNMSLVTGIKIMMSDDSSAPSSLHDPATKEAQEKMEKVMSAFLTEFSKLLPGTLTSTLRMPLVGPFIARFLANMNLELMRNRNNSLSANNRTGLTNLIQTLTNNRYTLNSSGLPISTAFGNEVHDIDFRGTVNKKLNGAAIRAELETLIPQLITYIGRNSSFGTAKFLTQKSVHTVIGMPLRLVFTLLSIITIVPFALGCNWKTIGDAINKSLDFVFLDILGTLVRIVLVNGIWNTVFKGTWNRLVERNSARGFSFLHNPGATAPTLLSQVIYLHPGQTTVHFGSAYNMLNVFLNSISPKSKMAHAYRPLILRPTASV